MYSLQKKTLGYRQDSRKSQNTKQLYKSVLQCHKFIVALSMRPFADISKNASPKGRI